MKKVVLGDDFGIAVECLSIDVRDRCWNASSTMNPIWTLENFGRRGWWKERDGWMGLLLVVYTIKCVKKEGYEQERAKFGEVGLENFF